MTDFLVYWRTFWEDVDNPNDPQGIGHDWHTNDEHLFRQVEAGDSLWVVISVGRDYPGEWRLLSESFIAGRDLRPHPEWARKYLINGDKRRSQHFVPILPLDATPILKGLRFESGNRIIYEGGKIGQEIQKYKKLTA